MRVWDEGKVPGHREEGGDDCLQQFDWNPLPFYHVFWQPISMRQLLTSISCSWIKLFFSWCLWGFFFFLWWSCYFQIIFSTIYYLLQRRGGSFWLLALDWLSPGHCSHLRSQPGDGRSFSFLSNKIKCYFKM